MALYTPQDVVVAVRNCFCDVLSEGTNPPAVCCITAGTASIPECCGGFAWVRPVRAWPAQDFPRQDSTPGRCTSGAWAMQVELGVARCAPTQCDVLAPICCESELETFDQLMDDFNRMRLALSCCLITPGYDGVTIDDVLPGPWTVDGPQGGCISSAMTATIRWSEGCACA